MNRHRRVVSAVFTVLLVSLGLAVAGSSPVGAVEQDFTECPSAAEAFADDSSAYPPYGAPVADDASPLIDCAGPFTAVSSSVSLELAFEFADLPTDPCYEIVDISFSSTGTPAGAGWAVVAFDNATGDPIILAGFPEAGVYQQFNAPEGNVLNTVGVSLRSPSLQPATGEYPITWSVDPSVLTLDELAAGQLGVGVVVLNASGPDVLAEIEATVTLEDDACPDPTTTTTSTTPAPAPTAPAPARPAAVVAATPAFTG